MKFHNSRNRDEYYCSISVEYYTVAIDFIYVIRHISTLIYVLCCHVLCRFIVTNLSCLFYLFIKLYHPVEKKNIIIDFITIF